MQGLKSARGASDINYSRLIRTYSIKSALHIVTLGQGVYNVIDMIVLYMYSNKLLSNKLVINSTQTIVQDNNVKKKWRNDIMSFDIF